MVDLELGVFLYVIIKARFISKHCMYNVQVTY